MDQEIHLRPISPVMLFDPLFQAFGHLDKHILAIGGTNWSDAKEGEICFLTGGIATRRILVDRSEETGTTFILPCDASVCEIRGEYLVIPREYWPFLVRTLINRQQEISSLIFMFPQE